MTQRTDLRHPVPGVFSGLILALAITLPVAPVFAAAKVFSGGAGTSLWGTDGNWSATGVPAVTDSVTIDSTALSVEAAKDFTAQSITVGGKTESTFTADSFVYGTITPASTSDPAILIRSGGTVVLSGSGVITVKGSFKNSEESLPSEPSGMILLQ